MTRVLNRKQPNSEITTAFGIGKTSNHCERGEDGRCNLAMTLLILVLAIGLLVIFTSSALAGGWHYIGDEDNPDAGKWLKSRSPHNNLQTSTNNCKTCHAVHDGDDGSSGKSFKLLRDKTRVSECNACHDATSGLSTMRPYQIGEFKKVRGEHSLGSTLIPDSDTGNIYNDINSLGISCGSCHSVHGAATLESNPDQGKFADPAWTNKLLKKDPAGNGGDASKGTSYTNGDIAGGFTVTTENSNIANLYAASKTAFCSDCHNKNSNWDLDSGDERPNNESHVQGPAVDGAVVVNGTKTQVADYGTWGNTETGQAGRSEWRLQQNTKMGCLSCHQATNGGASFPYNGTSSSFPHQSDSSKLLAENYTDAEEGWVNERVEEGNAKDIRQSSRGINQASRSLASMDKVCLDCHRNQRALGSDTMGVGKNF